MQPSSLRNQPVDRWTIPAAKRIEPLYQGNYDGLCGLYAIINALRLVVEPHRSLTTADTAALFAAGVAHLDEEGLLASCVCEGLDVKPWSKLAEHLVARCSALTGLALRIQRPFATARSRKPKVAFSLIEKILQQQTPILVSLEGAYNHYSIISGYTPTSLKLFDSLGYQRLRRSTCNFATDEEGARHKLDLRSVMVVGDKPAGDSISERGDCPRARIAGTCGRKPLV
ncbi:MAG: hypothetical protein JWM75_1626 [Sphingomonas bacterium]|nr:hypothetical protein [Sphingomonas bacterium]